MFFKRKISFGHFAFAAVVIFPLLIQSGQAQVLRDKPRDAAIAPGGLESTSLLAPEPSDGVDSSAQVSGESDAIPAARPSERQLLPQLKGIRLVAGSQRIQESVAEMGLTTVGLPMLGDNGVLTAWADNFLSHPVSMESLGRMQQQLRETLASTSYPFTLVNLPPQDISDGVVQLLVTQAVLDSDIDVRGNEHFSDKYLLSRIRHPVGEPVNVDAIKRGEQLINKNPYINASVKYVQGSQVASTGLLVDVKDRKPVRFVIGANNTGNELTGEERRYASFSHGNLWGLGHRGSLRFTSAYDSEVSRSVSGNYTVDFPWLHSLTVFGSRSNSAAEVNPPLSQEGSSSQWGVNYDMPLESQKDNYRHSLQWGVDVKKNDSSLQFQFFTLNLALTDNDTKVVQTRLQYTGTWAHKVGSTSIGSKLTFSPGDVGSKNDDDAFATSRAFASADYVYANFDIAHQRPAHLGFLGKWLWQSRMELQYANGNLVGSEQFSAGGTFSGRGYEEGEISGDNAVLLNTELQSKRYALGGFMEGSALSLKLFADYAITESADRLPGETSNSIFSLGYGFNFNWGNNLNVYLSHGFQLKDSRNSNSGDNHRIHLGAELAY